MRSRMRQSPQVRRTWPLAAVARRRPRRAGARRGRRQAREADRRGQARHGQAPPRRSVDLDDRSLVRKPRIVGGGAAGADAFPFIVSLVRTDRLAGGSRSARATAAAAR